MAEVPAERGTDPIWQFSAWVAMLAPVELADDTVLTDLREDEDRDLDGVGQWA